MVDHCIPLPGYIGCKPMVLGAGHTLCVQANHVIYTGAHIAREAQFIERGSLTHIDSRIFQDINHLRSNFNHVKHAPVQFTPTEVFLIRITSTNLQNAP